MRLFLLVFQDDRGDVRAVAGRDGRLLIFALLALASACAERLQRRAGRAVHVHPTTPGEVADLLLAAGVPEAELPLHASLVEAATLGPEDAVEWALRLADEVPLRGRNA